MIAQLVDEIATASQEQATGIEQLNKAVAEMDAVTQQTAVNAGESASAAEGMNTQANQMRSYIEDLAAVVGGSRHALWASPSMMTRKEPAVLAAS